MLTATLVRLALLRRRRRLHLLVQHIVILRLSRLVVDVLAILILELNVVIKVNVLLAFDLTRVVVGACVVVVALTAEFSRAAIVSRPLFPISDRRPIVR